MSSQVSIFMLVEVCLHEYIVVFKLWIFVFHRALLYMLYIIHKFIISTQTDIFQVLREIFCHTFFKI